MKRFKRYLAFLLFFIVMFSFCFLHSSARVHGGYYYYSLYDDRLVRPFHHLNGTIDSHLVVSATTFNARETDLVCKTTAINDYYGSVLDYFYTTAAYVSLQVELESGEIIYTDSVVKCYDSFCVTAEISAISMSDYKTDDVIKQFQSVHMIYNNLAFLDNKYIEGKNWVDTAFVDKHEKKPIERRVLN